MIVQACVDFAVLNYFAFSVIFHLKGTKTGNFDSKKEARGLLSVNQMNQIYGLLSDKYVY